MKDTRSIIFAICLIVLIPFLWFDSNSLLVDRVIDGDTIEADGERIRLIGINTPERKKCYYSEAKEFAENMFDSKDVELVKSEITKNRGYYKRLLRYVYVDGEDYGLMALKNGMAKLYKGKHEKREEYKRAEEYAKHHNIGLWKHCTN